MDVMICDDEATERVFLREVVERLFARQGVSLTLRLFESAEAFWFHYQEDSRLDILLLDIQMKEMDGVSLARRLRERDERCQIIFITGYSDFLAEGYEVSALQYLMKPVAAEKLEAALDRALARLSYEPPVLLLSGKEQRARIPQPEILYIEVLGHEVTVHAAREQVTVPGPLSRLEEQLMPESFVRCHRAFLVNLRHIRRVTRQAVELDGGQSLPLSRRLYPEVQQAFIRYYGAVRSGCSDGTEKFPQ